MDAELRELEKAAASGDADARSVLFQTRRRAGLGWDGETLPGSRFGRLVCSEEPGVYLWRSERDRPLHELVHVPAGRSFCYCVIAGHDRCLRCRGGSLDVGEFWVSRLPVTWREFLVFCDDQDISAPVIPGWSAHLAPRRRPSRDPDRRGLERTRRRKAAWDWFHEEVLADHPVVNVSAKEAIEFGAWLSGDSYDVGDRPSWTSAFRLLSVAEYVRAVYGGLEHGTCSACLGTGRVRTGLDSPKWLGCRHPPEASRPRTNFRDGSSCQPVTKEHPVWGLKSTAPVVRESYEGCPCGATDEAHVSSERVATPRTDACVASGPTPAERRLVSPFGLLEPWGNVKCIVEDEVEAADRRHALVGASWFGGEAQVEQDDHGFRLALRRSDVVGAV